MMANLIFLFCFFVQTSFAEEMQDIYEYKNKDGVIEFTDEVKPDESLQEHIQIKSATEEENALREEKLELIKAKDRELDKQLAIEREQNRQKELELEQQREEEKEEQRRQQQQAEQQQEEDYYRRPYWQSPASPHRR